MPLNPMGNVGVAGGEVIFRDLMETVRNVKNSLKTLDDIAEKRKAANDLIAEANALVKAANASEAAADKRASEAAAEASRNNIALVAREKTIAVGEEKLKADGLALMAREAQYREANAAMEEDRKTLKTRIDGADKAAANAVMAQKKAENAAATTQKKSDELDIKLAKLRAIAD